MGGRLSRWQDGLTAIMAAAEYNGTADIIKVLIASGADVNDASEVRAWLSALS